MTEAQKKAVEVQKEIEEACIRHGLNLTIFENGIGFVDPKENKIVMVWRPQYKPETPSLHPMEENTSADRNRPAEICPLSYLAVQREVADLWETKGNIQSEE